MGPRKVSRKRDSVSIKAGEFIIKPTETEKLLGCNLHQSMQWNSHIKDHSKSMIRQITTRVNGLRKISQNATFRTRLMIANGAVLSKLVYMITVWGGAQQYLLRALQVQQLAAARVVCGHSSRYWSRVKLLKRVGWLSIRQLVYYHTVLQAHKVIRTGKPAGIHMTISTDHPYRTRSATNERIRYGESFQGGSSLIVASFKHRAVHWFNQVSPEVYSGSLSVVKHKLKEWVRKNVDIDWG